MDNEKGVWRTIRGNHIFIKEGQTVEEAFKEHLERVKKEKPETKKKDSFRVNQQKYKEIELPRGKAQNFEEVKVKPFAEKLQKKLDKIFGEGNAEVFAHGSGKLFTRLSDKFGFSGEGNQVHGVGVYALEQEWERSKKYAEVAFKNAGYDLEVAGITKTFIGYKDNEIEDLADSIKEIYESHPSNAVWKKLNADEKRWAVANSLSGKFGKYGLAKARGMQNFIAEMERDDFADDKTLEEGLKRTIKSVEKQRDVATNAYSKLKPQILIGVVPPETKKRLFVTSHRGEDAYVKDQTPEVQESVRELVKAMPNTHYDVYEIDGEKYLYTPNSVFASVNRWDEKTNLFEAIPPAKGGDEILGKIEAIGLPNATVEQKRINDIDNLTYERLIDMVGRVWGGGSSVVSKKMAEYGIFGIKYDGYTDGRCIVQFDPAKFDAVARNYDGKWRGVSSGMTSEEKKGLRESKPYQLFASGAEALINDIRHYGIKNLDVITKTPEVHINEKGGFSSYADMEYTKSDGEKVRFRVRISDHRRHQPDKNIQVYQHIDPHMNGRSFEQKLKDKIAQIEKLKKGESLPVEKNTTSDENDIIKWSKKWENK